MTTTDPRVGEIQAIPAEAVEAAAKAAGLVFNEPANARDIEYIRTILEAAHPVLMAELRKAHEALARVEALADKWEAGYGPSTRKAEVFGPQKVSIEFAVKSIRAAVAAANGESS